MPFSRLREPASARCRFPSTVFRGRNGLFKKGCPAPSERSENMLWHRSVSYFSAATWCAAYFREFKRSEEHTSELQSRLHLVCRLLLEKQTHNTLAKCL